MNLRVLALFACLLAPLASCTWPPGGTTQTAARSPDGLTCAQRLVGGTWRFTGFTPDRPLDPGPAQALERLHGSLRLSFNGQQALTTGPALYHVGPYQIADDDGMSCRIIAPDDSGVVSETRVHFLDSPHRLEVLDRRSAVPGRATMERVAQGS